MVFRQNDCSVRLTCVVNKETAVLRKIWMECESQIGPLGRSLDFVCNDEEDTRCSKLARDYQNSSRLFENKRASRCIVGIGRKRWTCQMRCRYGVKLYNWRLSVYGIREQTYEKCEPVLAHVLLSS